MEDHFDISGAFEISKFKITGCTYISIGSVLASLCLLGAPMLLIKFQLNWIIVFRGDVQNMNSQHFPLYKCIGPIQMHGEANLTNVGPSF